MTLIIATPEKIFVDTRVTLKDALTDGMEEEHVLEMQYDGISKIMPTGVRTPESGGIHHTVGFGDVRVFKALNQLLSRIGLDSFIDCIPALADLMPKATHTSGLVWVDDRGCINAIVREANTLSYAVYQDEVKAFGHSANMLEFIQSFNTLTTEELFLLICNHCDYSSKGDYYSYDVAQKAYGRTELEPEVYQERIHAIRGKLLGSTADSSRGFVVG